MLGQRLARLNNESNGRLATMATRITNDVLDVETLKAFEGIQSEHGSDFVIELIDVYLQGTPQRIQTIREAAVEKQWGLLKRTAHTVKGSSSTLGLRRLAQVCQELEATSLSSSDAIDGLVDAVESQFVEAREALLAQRKRRMQCGSSHNPKQ